MMLHIIEYTLFYSVQVYKKDYVIYGQPLTILQSYNIQLLKFGYWLTYNVDTRALEILSYRI